MMKEMVMYLGKPEILIIVAVFSIIWFVIGVIVGRIMPKGRGTSRSKSSGDNLIEMYVGNLSYDVSEKELNREFQAFGDVASARIIKNRFNGKSKGFGFVEMGNRPEANAAIRALNGKDLKGRKIVVNEAKSQQR